jgi:hypothetical protein
VRFQILQKKTDLFLFFSEFKKKKYTKSQKRFLQLQENKPLPCALANFFKKAFGAHEPKFQHQLAQKGVEVQKNTMLAKSFC